MTLMLDHPTLASMGVTLLKKSVASQTEVPLRTPSSKRGEARLMVTIIPGGSSKLVVIPKKMMLAMTVTTAMITMKMTTQMMTFLRESSRGGCGWP
jgi:hypothetical protein